MKDSTSGGSQAGASGQGRRRPRQPVPRPRRVQVTLTGQEYAVIEAAARRAGLALRAYIAQAALAAAANGGPLGAAAHRRSPSKLGDPVSEDSSIRRQRHRTPGRPGTRPRASIARLERYDSHQAGSDTEEVTSSGDLAKTLSQLSRGLTGRYRTMASIPYCEQDADLPIRIPAH